MKVYVLEVGEVAYDMSVWGVYESEEKAMAAFHEYEKKTSMSIAHPKYDVNEWEVE